MRVKRTRTRTQPVTTMLETRKKLAGMMIGTTKKKLVRVKRRRRRKSPLRARRNRNLSLNVRLKKPKFRNSGGGRGGYYPLVV